MDEGDQQVDIRNVNNYGDGLLPNQMEDMDLCMMYPTLNS